MQHLAWVVRAGVVAVVAAYASAVLAAEAATGGAATPRWVFVLAAGASLIGAVAVNIATALPGPVERHGGGDVPELVRAARSGAHHHGGYGAGLGRDPVT